MNGTINQEVAKALGQFSAAAIPDTPLSVGKEFTASTEEKKHHDTPISKEDSDAVEFRERLFAKVPDFLNMFKVLHCIDELRDLIYDDLVAQMCNVIGSVLEKNFSVPYPKESYRPVFNPSEKLTPILKLISTAFNRNLSIQSDTNLRAIGKLVTTVGLLNDQQTLIALQNVNGDLWQKFMLCNLFDSDSKTVNRICVSYATYNTEIFCIVYCYREYFSK